MPNNITTEAALHLKQSHFPSEILMMITDRCARDLRFEWDSNKAAIILPLFELECGPIVLQKKISSLVLVLLHSLKLLVNLVLVSLEPGNHALKDQIHISSAFG